VCCCSGYGSGLALAGAVAGRHSVWNRDGTIAAGNDLGAQGSGTPAARSSNADAQKESLSVNSWPRGIAACGDADEENICPPGRTMNLNC
jgi:hypothetical protein